MTVTRTLPHRAPAPLAVRPTWTCMGTSAQDQPMQELVHALADGHPATRCEGSPISAGAVSMPPRHAARAHQHDTTWIYVVVLRAGRAGVVTRYGHALEHEFVHRAGDILVMPPGVPHAAINLSRWRSVYAIELRVSESVHRDNHLLTQLQHLADQRRPQPLMWPLCAATQLLRSLTMATRRWARRRSRTDGDRTIDAPSGRVSRPNVDSPPAVGAHDAADSADDDTSRLADRTTRAGPSATGQYNNGSHRPIHDWPIMDWSKSFPLRPATDLGPAHDGHVRASPSGAAEASVVIAAIDLLATALAVLRPRLASTAAAEHLLHATQTDEPHDAISSTLDSPQ